MTTRTLVRAALLVFSAGAATVALGAPRFTWENTGLRVDHPPTQGAAALVGAASLAGAALSVRPRAATALGFLLAAALAVLGVERLAWRVEALEGGLRERSIAGWTRIAWRDVEAVEPRAEAIRIRARGGATIAVDTRGFAPEDRTRFERTIARRLKEIR